VHQNWLVHSSIDEKIVKNSLIASICAFSFSVSGFSRGWEEYALSPGAALLASLGTALFVMALLMAVCLAVVCRRRRSSSGGGRSGRSSSGGRQRSSRLHHWQDEGLDAGTPQQPPSLLPPDPDRVALIAFADGVQVGQVSFLL